MQDLTNRCRFVGLYADSDEFGGAERSLLNLVGAYHHDFELVVISPSASFLEQAARFAPRTRRLRIDSADGLWANVVAHRRVFRAAGLDLLQITLSNPFASKAAVIAGLMARIPTVVVEQLVLPSRRRRGSVLKNLMSRPLSGHIAVGTSSAEDLHQFFGVSRSSISVVHNGVAEPIRTEDSTPRSSARAPVVGFVGRLEDQKNAELLVEAVSRLDDVQLVLVGDGSLRHDLEARVSDLGLEHRVEFVGWVDDPSDVITRFDVFVLPSRAESFPLTIVEAMLSGVAVVASDVGSVNDAVRHEETGLLVASEDLEGLVGALRRVLADDQLRHRLASAGRSFARLRFTDVMMADEYHRIWSKILGVDASPDPTPEGDNISA